MVGYFRWFSDAQVRKEREREGCKDQGEWREEKGKKSEDKKDISE